MRHNTHKHQNVRRSTGHFSKTISAPNGGTKVTVAAQIFKNFITKIFSDENSKKIFVKSLKKIFEKFFQVKIFWPSAKQNKVHKRSAQK